jgi:lipid-A-disaccharide synthase
MTKIMMLAGEASGDMHAAEVAEVLKDKLPGVELYGIAGPKMREQGVEVIAETETIAVMGFSEVLANFKLIKKVFKQTQQVLRERRPDLLILIDYPGFNLRMAKYAKSLGIKVLFYVSPQVWAWRQGRVKKIKACVDHMAVIFPFEKKFYDKYQVPATYVGCPLMDEIRFDLTKPQARDELHFAENDKVLALLPGSRKSVVEKLLPIMLSTAKKLCDEFSGLKVVIPVADTLSDEFMQQVLQDSEQTVQLVRKSNQQVIKAADAAICASGTATLETALLRTPMVVVYRMSFLSYQIIKRLIKIKHVSLCNIVAEKEVVKEMIQTNLTDDELFKETRRLLTDTKYQQRIQQDYDLVKANIGQAGAAKNVAQIALDLLAE